MQRCGRGALAIAFETDAFGNTTPLAVMDLELCISTLSNDASWIWRVYNDFEGAQSEKSGVGTNETPFRLGWPSGQDKTARQVQIRSLR